METLSVSVAWRVATLIAAILLPVSLTSCGKKGPEGKKKTSQKSEDDFLDKDAKPDESK
jgi:predicted small lipoprotein YifL